jgi:hypothetical protein
MAQGSEKISSKWVEGAERVCVLCGKEIKNLDRDVGEVRTRYGPKGHGTREIVCDECVKRTR